jgi:DNA-binding IscR family transcriptional regulator
VETLCPSRAGWHKINLAVERALAEVSIADLMGTPAMFGDPAAPRPQSARTA